MRIRWLRWFGWPLLTGACVAPPTPGLVLLSAPAYERVEVGTAAQDLVRVGPTALADGAQVALDGQLRAGPAEGTLLYVDVGVEGAPRADGFALGEDIREDAVWLVGPRAGAEAIGRLVDGSVRFEDDDVWRLEGDDLWALLVAIPDALEREVDELVPIAVEEDTSPSATLTGLGSSIGAAPRVARTLTRAPTDGADLPSDIAGHTQGGDELTAGVAGAFRAEVTGESADWVGLYAREGECVLLDASGGYRTCSGGIDSVEGTWTVSGGVLWTSDARTHGLDGCTHGLHWDGGAPLVRAFTPPAEDPR